MAPAAPAEPDPDAPVFCVEDEDAFKRHFEEFGFVVVGGVLEDAQVEATVNEIWTSPSLLGGYEGLRRDDPETWGGDDWPAGCRNFLDPLDSRLEVQSWRNRVAPTVGRVFDVLWQGLGGDAERQSAEAATTPIVSVDRVGVMRPTWVPEHGDQPSEAASGGEPQPALRERREWRTSRNWLHWDQNPWSHPGFYAVQGLLGLSEGDVSRGGFITVPGFHREFEAWAREHPEGSVPKCTRSTVPFSVPLGDQMQERRQKILVPRGGLLVWDSRMPHENFPNEGTGWRLVQYVTCKRLPRESLLRRTAAWHASLRTGLLPVDFARRFSLDEQVRLGMAASTAAEDLQPLLAALREGDELSAEMQEAAHQLRRAWRLKQTAMDPVGLKEARDLFLAAFAVNPALREPLQRVAAAEDSYLPFWIL